MVALIGDAEMDEGNIFEALLEGWKQGLRIAGGSSTIIVSRWMPSCVKASARLEALFRAFGWEVVILKYGVPAGGGICRARRREASAWIDDLPNSLYSALALPGRRSLAQAAQ